VAKPFRRLLEKLPKERRESIEARKLEILRDVEKAKAKRMIYTVRPPRAGWAEAFRSMAEHGDDLLLDGDLAPSDSL
jgi:hypothetical protein